MFSSKPSRRDFVTRLAAFAGATALLPDIVRAGTLAQSPGDELEPWLVALKGKHRQLHHSHEDWTNGIEYARRYKQAYPKEYGVKPDEVDSILAAHGKTGAITYVDAAWEKYGFGRRFEVKESPKSDTFATRNIFNEGTDDAPGVREAMAAGVMVLSCRTALRGLSHMLANEKKYGTYDEIERDLTASLIPGVVLVPSMIIAVGRAQEHGCAYVFTG